MIIFCVYLLYIYNVLSIYFPKKGEAAKRVFQEAVTEIEKVSCVRFVKRTTEKDYVRVISDPDGWVDWESVCLYTFNAKLLPGTLTLERRCIETTLKWCNNVVLSSCAGWSIRLYQLNCGASEFATTRIWPWESIGGFLKYLTCSWYI